MRFKDAEVIICRNPNNCLCSYKHKAKCLYFRVYDKEFSEDLKKIKLYYPILNMLQNKKSVSLLNLKSDNDVLRLVAETMIFKKCPRGSNWRNLIFDYIDDKKLEMFFVKSPNKKNQIICAKEIDEFWDSI
jgi:hypothetical protein